MRAYLRSGSTPRELLDEVRSRLDALEHEMGRTLGDSSNPLLLSVRSGAKFSMPGMMETVLNIGLNDESVHGLAEQSGNERFAGLYRRLIQMFGKTVLDLDGDLFADALHEVMIETGVESDVEIPGGGAQGIGPAHEEIMTSHGAHFPQDPANSCSVRSRRCSVPGTPARQLYRRQERIPSDLRAPPVNVQAMVFGNPASTPAPAWRSPATGHRRPRRYGDYLESAQGEDVVSGIRNTLALSDLERLEPGPYAELMDIMHTSSSITATCATSSSPSNAGSCGCCRPASANAPLALLSASRTQLVEEDLIDMDEAVRRVSGPQLAQLMFPQFDRSNSQKPSTKGTAASPAQLSARSSSTPRTRWSPPLRAAM